MRYFISLLLILFATTAFSQQYAIKRLRPKADTINYVITSDAEGVWGPAAPGAFLGNFIEYASVDDSTDASGEIVISHTHGDSLFALQVTVTDTFTNVPVPVIVEKTSTDFTLRFYAAKDGTLFATNAIRFDWLLLGL